MVTRNLQTLNLKFDQVMFNSFVFTWERNFEVAFDIFSLLVIRMEVAFFTRYSLLVTRHSLLFYSLLVSFYSLLVALLLVTLCSFTRYSLLFYSLLVAFLLVTRGVFTRCSLLVAF